MQWHYRYHEQARSHMGLRVIDRYEVTSNCFYRARANARQKKASTRLA